MICPLLGLYKSSPNDSTRSQRLGVTALSSDCRFDCLRNSGIPDQDVRIGALRAIARDDVPSLGGHYKSPASTIFCEFAKCGLVSRIVSCSERSASAKSVCRDVWTRLKISWFLAKGTAYESTIIPFRVPLTLSMLLNIGASFPSCQRSSRRLDRQPLVFLLGAI